MTEASINGRSVAVEVIEPDGTSGGALTPTEIGLIAALDTRLHTTPAFTGAYPDAHLTRVDSNRMVKDTDEGRFYLRYHHRDGDTEFWGHRAEAPVFDLERGIVAVGP